MEPWGTPDSTAVSAEDVPCTVTYCVRPVRRDQNKIEIPGQDPCEIGAGGRIYFFIFSHVHMYMTISVCMPC